MLLKLLDKFTLVSNSLLISKSIGLGKSSGRCTFLLFLALGGLLAFGFLPVDFFAASVDFLAASVEEEMANFGAFFFLSVIFTIKVFTDRYHVKSGKMA